MMSDKHERILDEYLKIASEEYLEEIEKENNKIMEKYKDIEYPERLDGWFYDQMHQKEKKFKKVRRLRAFSSFGKRSAAVLVVTLLIGLVVTLSVDAIRMEFMNLFIEETDQYDEYSLSSDDLLEYVEKDSLIYYPKYIPEGFKLDEYSHNNFETNIGFINGPYTFTVDILYDTTDIRVDNEDAVKSNVSINGKTGTLLQYKEQIRIILKVDTAVISVTGNLEKEEIIKISKKLF